MITFKLNFFGFKSKISNVNDEDYHLGPEVYSLWMEKLYLSNKLVLKLKLYLHEHLMLFYSIYQDREKR